MQMGDIVKIDSRQTTERIRLREKNEKINETIKNLYARGLPEHTDYENAVNEMKKSVLNAPENLQNEKYKELLNKMFNEDFERENRTIFKIGIPDEFELFTAFDLYENNADVWIKLIDFYFRNKNVNQITPDLIEVLLRCRINMRKVYLFVLKKFNSLQIVGNLNKVGAYKDFVVKYISAFSRLGYVDTHYLYMLEEKKSDWQPLVPNVLDYFHDKLKNLKELSPLKKIQDDIDVFMCFLEKNRSLVAESNELHESGIEVNTRIIDSNYQVDDLVEMCKRKNYSREDVIRLLNEKYEKELFKSVDVVDFWNKWTNEN